VAVEERVSAQVKTYVDDGKRQTAQFEQDHRDVDTAGQAEAVMKKRSMINVEWC